MARTSSVSPSPTARTNACAAQLLLKDGIGRSILAGRPSVIEQRIERFEALGHEVLLMPAGYVNPYVKRGENDEVDAEAICEAMTQPTMRFVPIKPAEQQAIQMLHRTRDLLVRQRTMLVNSLRGQLAEFGLVAPKGIWRIPELDILTENTAEDHLPDPARECARLILAQIGDLQAKIKMLEKTIVARHKANEMSQRLATIPGDGIITATAHGGHGGRCRILQVRPALRRLAVPQQNGTGGKTVLGKISKKGEPYLRGLLVLGARAVVRYVRHKPDLAG